MTDNALRRGGYNPPHVFRSPDRRALAFLALLIAVLYADILLLGRGLYQLDAPRLIGWAAHVDDMDALIKKLTAAKVALKPMTPGSRQRPSGQMLRWKALPLQDDEGGLLPFFIEWSKDSPHPSTDAPAGCRLERFELGAPHPAPLREPPPRLRRRHPISSARGPPMSGCPAEA